MGLSHTFNPTYPQPLPSTSLQVSPEQHLAVCRSSANSMLESYLNLGINPAAFHRLMVIACCGLDTLPHCATFITMCTVCGVTPKGSYKHVFPLTVIMPIFLTILCIIMALAGIV